jgi:hypothetical protein
VSCGIRWVDRETECILSVRGFCFLEKAKRLRQANRGVLTGDITKQYLDASAEYLKAARTYPQDDEKHACKW